jgi:hypothetical protein
VTVPVCVVSCVGQVRLDDPAKYQSIVDAEWNIIYSKLAECANSGAQIVLSRCGQGVWCRTAVTRAMRSMQGLRCLHQPNHPASKLVGLTGCQPYS